MRGNDAKRSPMKPMDASQLINLLEKSWHHNKAWLLKSKVISEKSTYIYAYKTSTFLSILDIFYNEELIIF